MRVTLDTSVFPAEQAVTDGAKQGVRFCRVSVTDREVEGSSFEVHLKPLEEVPESFVLDESLIGKGVLAGAERAADLDEILEVISNGSFPRDRSNLTNGQRRQLRDAMILEAHCRSGGEVFVTEDRKAFIRGGRRQMLQELLGTRICTLDEFAALLADQEN